MSKVKEINILTTDKSWWRVMVNDIAATKDGIIANRILAKTSVPARIHFETREIDCLGKQMYINTSNIIAIEIIRESEEEQMASEMRDYCEKYEPTYNSEDGSM